MMSEATFDIARNFFALSIMLIIIRKASWLAKVFLVFVRGGDIGPIVNNQHMTVEWVVRAGSVLIAMSGMFALFAMRPSHYSLPAASALILCLETMVIWRLLYFAPQKNYMAASLGVLFALSVFIEAVT